MPVALVPLESGNIADFFLFFRLCAVFGGIYILKKTADKLIIDSENRLGLDDGDTCISNLLYLDFKASYQRENGSTQSK